MPNYKDYWSITYTNAISGSRDVYMSIAFEHPETAKAEIRALRRDARKYKKEGFNLTDMINNGISIPSAMIGSYWRIKKGKMRTDTPTYQAYLESRKRVDKLNSERFETINLIDSLK